MEISTNRSPKVPVGATGLAKLLAASSGSEGQRSPKPKKENAQPAVIKADRKPDEKPKLSVSDRPQQEVVEEIRGKPAGESLTPNWGNQKEVNYDAMVRFLVEYSKIGNATKAADFAGIGKTTYKRWLTDEPRFRTLFDEARDESADHLEYEAWRRAVRGVDKPVFHQGVEVGVIKEYSDSLLMFLLRGSRPEKYRDRVEHTVKGEIQFKSKAAMLVGIVATVNKFRARVTNGDLDETESRAIALAIGGDTKNGNGNGNNHGRGVLDLLGRGNGDS